MLIAVVALSITTLAAIGGMVVLTRFHYREKEELFNRFMAKDFQSYNYFKTEHPALVRDAEKTADSKREFAREEARDPVKADARKKATEF